MEYAHSRYHKICSLHPTTETTITKTCLTKPTPPPAIQCPEAGPISDGPGTCQMCCVCNREAPPGSGLTLRGQPYHFGLPKLCDIW
ncbi:hypothetical protein AHF37_11968 [Paragonimus kellicotti]|nr:hypothetical protein AHF37_11968 [Paragonimus kellicotti]